MMYCSLCTQSILICTCNQTDNDAAQVESVAPAGWQFADTFAPDSIEFVLLAEAFVPVLTNLHGSFGDWTLLDCKWYSEHMDWEFVIDGDRSRIFPIQTR